MTRPTEPAAPMDDQAHEPQPLAASRSLTPAHEELITILAEHLVEQYLAEEERP